MVDVLSGSFLVARGGGGYAHKKRLPTCVGVILIKCELWTGRNVTISSSIRSPALRASAAPIDDLMMM